MTRKQERTMLRELGHVYKNCAERVEIYTRWRWIAQAISWSLIFVASLLGASKMVSGPLCLVIGMLGGFAGGVSLRFAASAKQLPFWVRYTTLRDQEVQARLEELKDV